MTHEVWTEGYNSSGNKCEAFCLGKFEGNTFDESVEAYNKTTVELTAYKDEKTGYWIIWGCRLFDNEIEARKSFG